MPEVAIKHPAMDSEDAKKAPKREPVDPGEYAAVIVNAPLGVTRGVPPLQKISVNFQLIHKINEDGSIEAKWAGRRVFQDYILEPDPSNSFLDEQRRYELRMLLDASGIVYTPTSFNNEHLDNKPVRIVVRHRTGKEKDEDGKLMVFSNVVKVDCPASEAGSDDDLV
jgi:hypothetical protein